MPKQQSPGNLHKTCFPLPTPLAFSSGAMLPASSQRTWQQWRQTPCIRRVLCWCIFYAAISEHSSLGKGCGWKFRSFGASECGAGVSQWWTRRQALAIAWERLRSVCHGNGASPKLEHVSFNKWWRPLSVWCSTPLRPQDDTNGFGISRAVVAGKRTGVAKELLCDTSPPV